MWCNQILILINLMFWMILLYPLNVQSDSYNAILVHPSDMAVKVNSTIILKCQVDQNKVLRVQWVKNGFGFGISDSDLKDYSKSIGDINKLSLPNPKEKGYYDLQIAKINLEDEGIYYCQATIHGGNVMSNKATVRVITHSDAPQILQLSSINAKPSDSSNQNEIGALITARVDQGDSLILQCSALNGRPAARLSWSIDDNPLVDDTNGASVTTDYTMGIKSFTGGPNGLISGSINNTYTKSMSNKKKRDSYSILTVKVNQIFNGKTIKCIAKSPGYEDFIMPPAQAKIEILIPPRVSIDVSPKRKNNEYLENSWITFTCNAQGRPNKFKWTWFVNGNEVELTQPKTAHTNEYRVKLTRSFNSAVVKCQAYNYRAGSSQISISVRYSPQFIENSATSSGNNQSPSSSTDNQSVYPADVGDEVRMHCSVDSNPPAVIHWSRQSSNDLLPTINNVLYKKNIQELDYGIYVCTASAPGFTPISRKVFLARKSAPEITSWPNKEVSLNDNIATIHCVINSIPLPRADQIKWSYQGRSIYESTKYSMYDKKVFGVTTTYLQINNLESSDFGEYNCSVSTKLGSDYKTLKLVKKNTLPLILTVGGVTFLVIIILMVLVTVCLWRHNICNTKYYKGATSNHHHPNSNLVGSGNHNDYHHNTYPHNINQYMHSSNNSNHSGHSNNNNAAANMNATPSHLNHAPILHSNTSTITTHDGMHKTMDMADYYLPNNNMFPRFSNGNGSGNGNGVKSSFVKYGMGQDVDDKSSIRNGSVNQYRGIDMCSNYTGSIPGSNNGEKSQLRMLNNMDIEEIYNTEGYNPSIIPTLSPSMMCSMHLHHPPPPASYQNSPGPAPLPHYTTPSSQLHHNFILPSSSTVMDIQLPPSLPPLDHTHSPSHNITSSPSTAAAAASYLMMTSSQHHQQQPQPYLTNFPPSYTNQQQIPTQSIFTTTRPYNITSNNNTKSRTLERRHNNTQPHLQESPIQPLASFTGSNSDQSTNI